MTGTANFVSRQTPAPALAGGADALHLGQAALGDLLALERPGVLNLQRQRLTIELRRVEALASPQTRVVDRQAEPRQAPRALQARCGQLGCDFGGHRPGEAARFYFNGKLRGEVREADFARRVFGIWLSPQTSEPKLRLALLGGPRAGS